MQEVFPHPIRGRAFMTRTAIFVPCEERLYRVSLKSKKIVDEYPNRLPSGDGGVWEEPEEPGNVLATNDYVIVAGAKMLNVYTDLTLAKAKLDRELACDANRSSAAPALCGTDVCRGRIGRGNGQAG